MELTIARRFRGPRESGNGGYTCGRVAALLGDGPAEVTLLLPPPLDRPLRVERRDGGVAVLDGDAVVAEARPDDVEVEAPAPPSFDGRGARGAAGGRPGEPVPGVLRVRPRARARRRAAHLRRAARRPRRRHVDAGASSAGPSSSGPRSTAPARTARARPAAARRCSAASPPGSTRCPVPGEPCVVVGWPLGEDGRKLFAGTALYGEGGRLLGVARATWIVFGA